MSDLNDIYKQDLMFKSDVAQTATGDIALSNGLENVKLALFRRLITTKGTIAHRPDYGVGIKDFSGSLNSVSNQRILSQRIREEFEKDPRVKSVAGVTVKYNQDPSLIEINVTVNVLGFGDNTIGFIPFGDTV